MIETFREFAVIAAPRYITASGTYSYDDKVIFVGDKNKKRSIDARPIDISEIPDLSEIKSYEDD